MNSFESRENFVKFLIPQTDFFHPVSKYGCNFRALQAMAEVRTRMSLTHNQIEDLYIQAISRSYMRTDCYIREPEEIINSVFKLCKSKYRAWNCGKVIDGKAFSWGGKPIDFDYSIIKLMQPNKKDNHFVLADNRYELLFDPYPNSQSVKNWNIKDIYLYTFYEG